MLLSLVGNLFLSMVSFVSLGRADFFLPLAAPSGCSEEFTLSLAADELVDSLTTTLPLLSLSIFGAVECSCVKGITDVGLPRLIFDISEAESEAGSLSTAAEASKTLLELYSFVDASFLDYRQRLTPGRQLVRLVFTWPPGRKFAGNWFFRFGVEVFGFLSLGLLRLRRLLVTAGLDTFLQSVDCLPLGLLA